MRSLLIGLAMLAGLALSACATAPGGAAPPTPKAALAALEVALTAADHGALAYIGLPPCSPSSGPLCSETDIVRRIGAAVATARDATKVARQAVDDVTAAPDTVTKALAAARAALLGLQILLPQQVT